MFRDVAVSKRVFGAVLLHSLLHVLVLPLHAAKPGQWLPVDDYDEFEEEIEKEILCSEPGKIANGETVVWGEGMLLEYRCKPGYSPVGITHGACDVKTGTWTIEPPVCTDEGCPQLTPPAHGIVNVDTSGGLATIVCRPGYFLLGDTTLVCEEGQWRGSYPVCAVNPETNEHTKSRRGQGENTVLKHSYSMPGITLDDSDETCFYNHVTPPDIQHAVVETTYVMNEAKHRYVMVATYKCMGGYKLRSNKHNTLFCKNLIWTAPRAPECIADDDSCEEDNGGCAHYCTPEGSKKYACSCYDGYKLGTDAKSCSDTDECAIEKGGCQHECVNTEGSFFCTCTEGFIPKGRNCVDIDECVKTENQCPGPCINTPGSFHCDCNIKGFQPSKTHDYCEDADECADHNGGCDDVCVNKRGTYECRCETKGRKLGDDGHSCVDVDECLRYKGKVCSNGVCLNTEGSYTCTCNHGYRQTRNNSFCEDLDECQTNNGGCQQLCENNAGSFTCACKKGYVIADDKISCKDVNECMSKNAGCEDMCMNTEGSYTCGCTHVGRVLSSDGRSCKECLPHQYFNRSTWSCNDCPPYAHARDPLALSKKDCKCNKGFHGNPARRIECQDTNECQTGELRCSVQCVNTIGSAYCSCPKGYETDSTGLQCIDVNECETASHNCSQLCENTNGSYVCQCQPGFLLDKDRMTCTDIDECQTNATWCQHVCANTEGSYNCVCKDGYDISEDGMACEDINECKKEPAPCEQICNNTEGSYFCSCDGPGFKLSKDQTTCLDINECMEGDNPCPNICINTIGSYLCDCDRPGYLLASDASGCEDINECASNPCPHQCVNTLGSFKCLCPLGYADPPENNQTLCTECPRGTYRGVGETSCKRCPPRTNTSSTGSQSIKDCDCLDGYKEDVETGLCIDVNECKSNKLQCQHMCSNTEGSAHCTCRPGFTLNKDGISCSDVNECNKQNGGCEHLCVNTPGSFNCACKSSNFKLADNGLSCQDINECQTSTHGCQHRCVNTPTGAKCVCPKGFELISDGKSCKDIDECRIRNGGCTDLCVNTAGSHTCRCTRPGYKLYTDNKQCVDINECEVDKATCDDLCVNTVGSFKCYCRQAGYTLAQDKRTCEDIDECAKGKICQQMCINLPGSFRCDCQAGYFKQGHGCSPCPVGTYRDKKASVVSCQKCPPGMTTSRKATETVLGCYCLPGFHGNPETLDKCTDINECARSGNGGCEQICNNTEGSYFCSCKDGYALNEDKKSCNPTKCPLLTPPEFAKFTTKVCTRMKKGEHILPGTECFYQCRKFMTLRGPEKRTCLENFTWSDSNPECFARPCERLPVPENGYLYPPICMLPKVPFATRCSFRCNKDFQSVGSAGSKCRATGHWSGKHNHRCVTKR